MRLIVIVAVLASMGLQVAGAQGVQDTTQAPSAWPDSLSANEVPPVLPADRSTESIPSPVASTASGDRADQPVYYTARDSLRITFAGDSTDTEERDRATLYGNVEARYGDATLSAGQLEILFDTQELRARSFESDSGSVGLPTFASGEERFTGRTLAYSLQTRRGRVTGARTAIEDGYLLGGIVKQATPDIVYAADAAYTTCSLDHPHYSLVAGRMKVVDAEHVYTGPVQLYLLGIPTPLLMPFGLFPTAEGRRSGPLPITYGEDRSAFGFFLDNVGWYWAASDYFDLLARAKFGTRGSYRLGGRVNYVRRYRYDGALDVSYQYLRNGEPLDLSPPFTETSSVAVRWDHSQEFSPTMRLSGNVNLTSQAQQRTSNRIDEQVSQTTTSHVNFSKNWPRQGRSLTANLSATQQLRLGAIDLTLPTVSFRQQALVPFKREARAGRQERWYEKIRIGPYSTTLTNSYSFTPLPDSVLTDSAFADVSWVEGLFDYSAYRGATGEEVRFRSQAQHQLPLSASFSVNRLPLVGTPFRLNWSPSLQLSSDWYPRTQRRSLDTTGATVTRQEAGFTAIQRARLGVSANTEFYGTFPLSLGRLNGLRHIVRPQASFSYEPDYSAAPFSYYRTVENGDALYPIGPGLPARPGRIQQLSFGLGNVFQSRLVESDSTGETQRRTIQLFTLGLRSSYNFVADERPLGDIALDLTSQYDPFRLRADVAFSPYALDTLGALTPRSYFTETGRLLRTTRVTLSLGASFRGGRSDAADPTTRNALPGTPLGYDPLRPLYSYVPAGFTDFSSPWSFSVDLTYGYTPIFNGPSQKRAVLSVPSFDFALTPSWKINGSTGLDLTTRQLATTRLSVLRDLHCWEMWFNWIPFGDFRSFSFSLYVKSGHLRDLLRLDVPRSDVQTPVGAF